MLTAFFEHSFDIPLTIPNLDETPSVRSFTGVGKHEINFPKWSSL